MEVRALTQPEQKYTYSQSTQIAGQTGCIGHLRGDFDSSGNGFYTTWDDHWDKWKTDEFKAELDEVINTLCEGKGLLHNRRDMAAFARANPEAAFMGNYCTEYGFRVDTEKHAFLLRCNPTKGDYNFYCYCYVKDWLDGHAERVKQGVIPAPSEPAKQDNSDLIGTELTIDNRRYLIESIGEISGDVSMRDITFQNNVGFPINRVEKIGYARRLLEQAEKEIPPEEKTEAPAKPPVPAYSDNRRNYHITDNALGVGGAKEKFRNNMAAVNLLHELQLENRLATPEEQETLAKYVGWGGLSMAFDENNAAWAEEFKELYASLSPEEYRAAKESTLTAFYTASIITEAEKSRDAKGTKDGQPEPEIGVQEKAEKDKLLDALMGKPVQKEENAPNPLLAKTEKSPLSEPTSEQPRKSAEGATMTKDEKPSVREELRKIKESRKEQEADASPTLDKEKSSDRAKKMPAGKTEHKQPQRKKSKKSKGAR